MRSAWGGRGNRLLAAGTAAALALAAASGSGVPAGAIPAAASVPSPGAEPARTYTPAILRLAFTQAGQQAGDAFLDLTLIPPEGELIGRRVEISPTAFGSLLRRFYSQMARHGSLDLDQPTAPARALHELLIGPLQSDLERLGITTLLISAEAGLQAVPFAALHDGERFFGERYAFAITPALALTRLEPPPEKNGERQLSLGASLFDGLAPLPLVPQELERAGTARPVERHVDAAFTPEVLLERAGDPAIDRVHVATHAEFLPGGPSRSLIHTGRGSLSLRDFSRLRQREGGEAIDLFTLSACRTALGDASSELGFAGLALQAGSRSAAGSLWYVDDVATSAFYVQFYRFLDAGLPKAEALQATRRAMFDGTIRVQADRILGFGDEPLLTDLTPSQQRRVALGMRHPFFWAGFVLLGSPW